MMKRRLTGIAVAVLLQAGALAQTPQLTRDPFTGSMVVYDPPARVEVKNPLTLPELLNLRAVAANSGLTIPELLAHRAIMTNFPMTAADFLAERKSLLHEKGNEPWLFPPYDQIYYIWTHLNGRPSPEARQRIEEAIKALPPEADQWIIDIMEMAWFGPDYHENYVADYALTSLISRGTLPEHISQRMDALVAKVSQEDQPKMSERMLTTDWVVHHWKFDPAKGETLTWQLLDAGSMWIWSSTYYLLSKTGNSETIRRLQWLAQYVSTHSDGEHRIKEIQKTIAAIEKRLAVEKPAFDGLQSPAPKTAPVSSSTSGGVVANSGSTAAKPDRMGWLFAALFATITAAALHAFRSAFRTSSR